MSPWKIISNLVIDYRNPVIYYTSSSTINTTFSLSVAAHQKPPSRPLCRQRVFTIVPSFLNQITSRSLQSFSFSILYKTHRLKSSKTPKNGWIFKETQDSNRCSLPPWCHRQRTWRNNCTFTAIKSFLFRSTIWKVYFKIFQHSYYWTQISWWFYCWAKFECYDILHNLGLLPFLTNRQCYYPELVRVFYSNLQITDEGVILSEVKHVKIRMDINMFYCITKLGTQGVYFEGNMVEEWRDDYSSHNAKVMIYRDNANIGGWILAGQMKVETRILHYILCWCLVP